MPQRLAYKRLGNTSSTAPPVVMLHGFMGVKEEWAPYLLPYLADYQFIVMDLPGHGESPNPEGGFAGFHQALLGTLSHLKVQHYRLYGYSLGGRLALYHAAQAPKGLTGLMIESAHPGLDHSVAKRKRQLWAARWQQRLLQSPGHRAKNLRLWYQQKVFASLSPKERGQQIQQKLSQFRPWGWAMSLAQHGLQQQTDLTSTLYKPQVPTRYLCGHFDIHYAQRARQMQRQHVGSRIAISPLAGHNVHVTQSTRWHHAFRQWLLSGSIHD